MASETVFHLDNNNECNAFKKTIEINASKFANELGYKAENYTPHMESFWLNEMKKGNASPRHTHYTKHFSGCFYVDMPNKAPGIKFYSPVSRIDKPTIDVRQHGTFNSTMWEFLPEEGQLYMWESWIEHEVVPTDFEGVRRTAAFDIMLKRNRATFF